MRYYYGSRFKEHWEDIAKMVEENYSQDYDDNDCLILSVHLIKDIHNGVEIIEDYNPDYNKKIVYQLEPLVENHWCGMTDMINCIRDYDEVWDYDLNNIEILKQNGIDAKFKPLIYSENLKKIENKKEPDIDVLFYGTQTDYRIKTISTLIGRYLYCDINFISINNVTGSLLDDFISRSKIILDLSNDGHLHQRLQKQTRIFYALINNKCVISEKSDKNYFGNLITEVNIGEDLSELGNTINDYIYNKKWKNYLNVSDKFKQMTENNLIKTMKNEDKIKKMQEITTAWTDHVVFAQWLVNRINPKVIVDLGVDYGYSTFSFAIPQIGHVYGIDSFEGDCNSGIRNTIEIANENKKSLELNNITFIKGYFDEIAKVWDKPIDILHIDGFHSYESVKNDYETWSKFVNDDGVILFHDTIVEDKSFGVKKFFEEIDLPKVNFTCSFGLGVVSKNKEIIEEISKFFNLPLHVPQKKDDKIAVFYHLYQQNSWKDLYNEQINSLINSGIYDKCDFIHIGINGDQELPFILDKMRINYNENKILEADTLKSVYDFCNENPDYKILYFHSKGITHTEDNYLSTTTNSWRKYLEYYVINKWEECVEDLNEYDCVGTEWINESRLWNSNLNDYSNEINPHYSGNFWWANAEYLKNLDLNYIYNDEKDWTRWKSEFWIGTKNPKYKSYHNSNKLLYDFNYTPDYYMKTESLIHKKPKIVMISMFKNESKGIRRMLESVWRHIDFYVFQDNGSTDGTPDIVKEFFADKDIPGFIYNIEEGWVGFGWNRDHLLQTCLKTDHGCDWIMKMDCDEYLEVDDDFDWSPFYNTNTESFHVTAQNPGCVYYRAWIWNAKLPWKFNHDVAHECIYLDNEKGENFERVNLPCGLRMVGTNDGESYTVRTKYITDALKLEEKMIREETMLTDTYHFWYIAKSYMDCYAGDFYALGQEHSKEFARRFIFYFEEYLKHMNVSGIHEMSYFSTFSIGLGYKYLKEYEKAIEWFNAAEKYCPVRNEHIVHLAQTYNDLQQYDKMLEQTTRLINPERKLPFPDYYFLIDNNIYCDSGDYPQYIHDYALSKISEEKNINSFSINITTKPRLWIVDDFYADPYAVREFALQQEFEPNLNYYKGSRTKEQYIVPGTKEAFEKIIGKKITNWSETHGMCGRFQYCTAEDALVYHCDGQTLAGMIYLTPDAPFSCGTSLYAHKDTKLRNENDFEDTNVFEGGFYDKSKFELVDTAGNVFNRLVLFDAKCIHSANEYFGTTKENSRLFQLFFFD